MEQVESTFAADVDFAQLIKLFKSDVETGRERYSPVGLLAITKSIVQGNPFPI